MLPGQEAAFAGRQETQVRRRAAVEFERHAAAHLRPARAVMLSTATPPPGWLSKVAPTQRSELSWTSRRMAAGANSVPAACRKPTGLSCVVYLLSVQTAPNAATCYESPRSPVDLGGRLAAGVAADLHRDAPHALGY
jgi:hypothetical protein